VSTAEATYGEATARRKVAAVPLSHLSIELGHLYREDFTPDAKALAEHFAWVAPWVQSAKLRQYGAGRRARPRISTCFLIDDYFAPFSSPAEVIPALCKAAEESGLQIDYIAREAGCAISDGVALASMVKDRLVPEPPADTDGSRPPAIEIGWLSNGQRSPSGAGEAMGRGLGWLPPLENSARRHSVFVDVELWSDEQGKRTWSCAFLAAVWQLVRLGMLRHNGSAVAVPQPFRPERLGDWEDLPAVVQLNPRAAPFCAYRTQSVLPNRFRLVELAVQVILSQLAVDDAVIAQIAERSEAEGFRLPSEIVDRINYVFDEGVTGGP